MNHIELDRVSKTFGERIVIDDLSLEIQKAERLVLFGPPVLEKPPFCALSPAWKFPTKARFGLQIELSQTPEGISFRRRNGMSEWCFKISRSGLI